MTIGFPMRSVVLLCSIGFLVMLVNSGSWLADQLAIREDDSVLEARLHTFIVSEMDDKRIPGLSLSLVFDQNTVMETGIGLADPESETPASPYTVYRGGHLAQLFTTIAVLQRVEQQKIDLDLPASDYLSRFMPYNPYGLPVTLRQILSHQSGLVTEPPVGHTYDSSGPELAEIVGSLNRTAVVYPPETFTKYSNAGFAIAGRILETSLEKPFEKHMRAILDRMYLKRTSFTPRLDLKNKLATGHISTFDERQFRAPFYELANVPAANLYTTVNDLGAFLKVLFADGLSPKGRILDAETFEQMWTVQMQTARRQWPYGLGFAMSVLENERRASISSNIHGFSARVDLLPDRDMGIALLANSEQGHVALERIASYALRMMLAQADNKPLPPPPFHDAPDATMKRRAIGHYDANRFLQITEVGNELYLYDDLKRFRLRQEGDSLIIDDRNLYGPVLVADGVTLLYKKQLFSKRGSQSYTPIADQWTDLRGMYGSSTHPVIVTDFDGRLHAIKAWHESYPLAETAVDTFALPDEGLYGGEKVYFSRNEMGTVDGVEFANMYMRRLPDEDIGYSYASIPLASSYSAQVAIAFQDAPPDEMEPATPSELVDLALIDPLLNIDMPLASADNLFGEQIYDEARALLQKPLAEALFRVQRQIRREGYELIIYDAYRPWYISKAIWESVPDSLKFFFDDPTKGSCQNRGAAVSLNFFELATGNVMPMPTAYGELASFAFSDSPLPDHTLRWNRERLRRTMEAEGFHASPTRWWHYIHESCSSYPIVNESFAQIDQESMLRQQRIFTLD